MVVTVPQIDLPLTELAGYCRRNGIIELALFGSALREDFGPESDMDLLVTFSPDAQIGFMALGRIERDLASLLHCNVDLIPKPGLHPRIRNEVLSTSQVLYAAAHESIQKGGKSHGNADRAN